MSAKFRELGLKIDDPEKDHLVIARTTEVKDFGKSMTSQSSADAVDVNKLVARIEKGLPVMTSAGQPFYGDVSDLGGLQEAIIKVQEAEDLFMQYPALVREKFENDPVQLISFLEDEKNYEEALKLGLVSKRPDVVPEPQKTPAPAGAGV